MADWLAGKRMAHQSLVAFLGQAARRLDTGVACRAADEGLHPPPYAVSVHEIGPENYIG